MAARSVSVHEESEGRRRGESRDRLPLVAVVLLGVWGCSGDGSAPGDAANGAGSGGVPGVANAASGGSSSSGGAIGIAGVPQGSGGSPSAGGATANGGTGAGGIGAGGASGAASGGAPSAGGSVNTGGANAGGASGASRVIVSPPSYMGTANGSPGCNTSSPTLGFEPVGDGKHPLFLYFVGTTFSPADTSARYDSLAAKTVTEAMARRGFVALSVQYDNTLSLSADKVTCVYASSNARSLLAVACQLPNVNCDLGIATWGHSQGALMAHIASQFEPRVRAVWTTGYSGGSYPLSNNRLRVVNGEADTMNAAWDTIKKAAGYGAAECPNSGGSECLRPDGSGFVIVRKLDCVKSSADHCWFDRTSCASNAITLEPNWTDKASTKKFALESNADWVAATVGRP